MVLFTGNRRNSLIDLRETSRGNRARPVLTFLRNFLREGATNYSLRGIANVYVPAIIAPANLWLSQEKYGRCCIYLVHERYGGRGRRVREDRKIHNALVTNYVLPPFTKSRLAMRGRHENGPPPPPSPCVLPSLLLIRVVDENKGEKKERNASIFLARPPGEASDTGAGGIKKVDEEKRPSAHCDARGFFTRI